MTSRKGNLMGVRGDLKVLDATIRDGGLCNNFDFTDEFVTELYKTNIKSGVDYMEFGYKASRELFSEKDFGKWKFCKEEDIRAIVGDNISDMKISVMADVGRCDFKKDFLPRSESVIDMVRVACYIHQMPAAIEMIEYLHNLGYETCCNIMAVSQVNGNQLEEALEMLVTSSVDVIYLVDSYGSLYPEMLRIWRSYTFAMRRKPESRWDSMVIIIRIWLLPIPLIPCHAESPTWMQRPWEWDVAPEIVPWSCCWAF